MHLRSDTYLGNKCTCKWCGIAKTVRWYLDNEWWWRPLRDTYDGERLGLVQTGPK